MKKRTCLSSYLLFLLLITPAAAGIKPGDITTQETISHKISYWTFRLLAEKEILAGVHSVNYLIRSGS